jgi:peptidoglycan/xylan/chitin deacetylase (PgdA/CDA1 family)
MRSLHLRRRVASRTRHGRTTAALALLYHRVAEPDRDPLLLAVSPARFAEHLEVLASAAVVPLAALRGRGDGVAITFDDGYADNLDAAARLAEAGLPATVFVTAGLLGEPPWWDVLARVVPEEEVAERFRALRPLPPAERASALAGLEGEPPDGRVLTADELRALAAVDGIEIGAHTCTHPMLSALPLPEQRREIEGSKRMLEAELGRPVTSFAYPFGAREDYDDGTVAAVRAAGFERACVNEPARLRARCDPFRLPRFLVRDWDGDTFARRLAAWLA